MQLTYLDMLSFSPTVSPNYPYPYLIDVAAGCTSNITKIEQTHTN